MTSCPISSFLVQSVPSNSCRLGMIPLSTTATVVFPVPGKIVHALRASMSAIASGVNVPEPVTISTGWASSAHCLSKSVSVGPWAWNR